MTIWENWHNHIVLLWSLFYKKRHEEVQQSHCLVNSASNSVSSNQKTHFKIYVISHIYIYAKKQCRWLFSVNDWTGQIDLCRWREKRHDMTSPKNVGLPMNARTHTHTQNVIIVICTPHSNRFADEQADGTAKHNLPFPISVLVVSPRMFAMIPQIKRSSTVRQPHVPFWIYLPLLIVSSSVDSLISRLANVTATAITTITMITCATPHKSTKISAVESSIAAVTSLPT